MSSPIAKVYLKKDIKKRVQKGHPWIYDNEIDKIIGEFENGDIVDVFSFEDNFIGRGYINQKSKITVRLLTRKYERIDYIFFEKRIKRAIENRFSLVNENAFRVIFGEADGLPGLIVDKFDRYLVVEFNTLGMEKQKDVILKVLVDLFSPLGIYEKSESSSRNKEGLSSITEWIYGSGLEIIPFEVNGLKFLADLKGQKTGSFLDQRFNALELSKYSQGKVCLDCFSYTGNFGMHMLKGGAKHVTFVDYSERALEIAKEIAKLNNFENCDFVNANAFDFLKSEYGRGKKYDIINLDPPSFAKSGSSRESAFKGYKEINLRSMKLLRDGGILGTSSCTQVVSQTEFENILYESATDARVLLRLLHRGGQPADHPQVYNILETIYLKFLILQVLEM